MDASVLDAKNIVLGVCGGIAAYKSVELLRLLTAAGARVRVAMTANAGRFVGALTFQALSGMPVAGDLFAAADGTAIGHIQWAREADGVVIAPATANMVAKMAAGIADDALSTFLLAVTAPVLVCPAMNSDMYAHPAVRRNLEILRADGLSILEPEAGALACGTTGPGRLPAPEVIADRVAAMLRPSDFSGRRVLVTAGPTREAIDPVRFLSNPSSGKMGYALARAAEQRGAAVTLVSGPVELPAPFNVSLVRVTTAEEMHRAVERHAAGMDLIVKAAAVSDFRPRHPAEHKLKKTDAGLTLELERTVDILAELGRRRPEGCYLMGFAAETQDLLAHARDKLIAKRLDMIVANLVTHPDGGFGKDTNAVTVLRRDGSRESLPAMAKTDLAHLLLDRVAAEWRGSDSGGSRRRETRRSAAGEDRSARAAGGPSAPGEGIRHDATTG